MSSLRTSRSKLFLLVLAAAIVLAGSLSAQGRGEVVVTVTDSAGSALADVAVTVVDGSGATRAQGTTNKKGKYELTLDGPEASYDVTFEKPGLGTETMAVQVRPGMVSDVTIKLMDEALQNKQRAVESFNEGVGLLQGGNEEGALEKFVAAAELDPELAEAQRLIAIIEAGRGNIDVAAPALERFLELAPDNLQAAAPAAYPIYRAQGRTDELPAVREHLSTLGIAGEFARQVYNEGVAAVRAEEEQEAIALFEEAIALDPMLPAPYQSIAALHFNEQEFDAALPYLEKLANVAPENVEGQRMTFYSRLMKGDHDAAKAAGKRWLTAMPPAKGDLLKKGEEMFEAGQSTETQVIAETLIEADGSYGPAHYLLGRVLAGAGKTAEAKQHLQHFLDLSPDHPEVESARQMLAGL
ncbi:MAG TPA: carboxypeptidase regulatory-like domain-containing protein [Thermoanaerobaculia bacterium]|nr:carboxypeptidase regulatory-like domain-containing protein [Thermoanaerobaculia bacterium]